MDSTATRLAVSQIRRDLRRFEQALHQATSRPVVGQPITRRQLPDIHKLDDTQDSIAQLRGVIPEEDFQVLRRRFVGVAEGLQECFRRNLGAVTADPATNPSVAPDPALQDSGTAVAPPDGTRADAALPPIIASVDHPSIASPDAPNQASPTRSTTAVVEPRNSLARTDLASRIDDLSAEQSTPPRAVRDDLEGGINRLTLAVEDLRAQIEDLRQRLDQVSRQTSIAATVVQAILPTPVTAQPAANLEPLPNEAAEAAANAGVSPVDPVHQFSNGLAELTHPADCDPEAIARRPGQGVEELRRPSWSRWSRVFIRPLLLAEILGAALVVVLATDTANARQLLQTIYPNNVAINPGPTSAATALALNLVPATSTSAPPTPTSVPTLPPTFTSTAASPTPLAAIVTPPVSPTPSNTPVPPTSTPTSTASSVPTQLPTFAGKIRSRAAEKPDLWTQPGGSASNVADQSKILVLSLPFSTPLELTASCSDNGFRKVLVLVWIDRGFLAESGGVSWIKGNSVPVSVEAIPGTSTPVTGRDGPPTIGPRVTLGPQSSGTLVQVVTPSTQTSPLALVRLSGWMRDTYINNPGSLAACSAPAAGR